MIPPEPIDVDKQPIPEGSYLLEGKFLVATLRAARILYTVATRRLPYGSQLHTTPIGVILSETDRDAVEAAMARRAAAKQASLKYQKKPS